MVDPVPHEPAARVPPTRVPTFRVSVPADDAEIAADRLWQLGVEAVGIDDPVAGRVELWTSVGSSTASIERAAAALDDGWQWHLVEPAEPVDTWREHTSPTWYSAEGVVVPAWQADDPGVAGAALVTLIEPAASFGLGDHPTTRLSLGLLTERLRSHHVDRVLDVGCGSGVLGIVAAQSGVDSVRAVDLSAAAVEATQANAVANGVAGRVEADTTPLSAIDGTYDVVVANILAPTLIALADHLRRVVAEHGALVISGILADSHDHVLAALHPLEPLSSRHGDGWAAVLLGHSPD